MSTPSKPVEVTVVDTNAESWQLLPIAHLKTNLEHVPLLNDEETGVMIVKMVYRAGFTNPWHTHSCGHGFYVLDGTLKTHRGNYPAGSFVWFPEGGVMEHGATDDADCTFLFVTNKGFDIHFVGDETDPDAPTMSARGAGRPGRTRSVSQAHRCCAVLAQIQGREPDHTPAPSVQRLEECW